MQRILILKYLDYIDSFYIDNYEVHQIQQQFASERAFICWQVMQT